MNTEPKILLTIYMEGGVLLKGEPEVRKYALTKKELFPNQKFKNKEGNKVIKKGKYIFTPTIPSTATRKITMCKDAYDYFISPACPVEVKVSPIKSLMTNGWRTLIYTKRGCTNS